MIANAYIQCPGCARWRSITEKYCNCRTVTGRAIWDSEKENRALKKLLDRTNKELMRRGIKPKDTNDQ